MTQNARRRPLVTDGAQGIDHAARLIGSLNNRNHTGWQIAAIRAELIGSNKCAAEGITGHGTTPVLNLCRELIKSGFDPGQSLVVYRGATLALRVRSIGETAELEINSGGSGFIKRRRAVRPAPPMRQHEFWGAP
jgi:hypothetical protein